MTPLNLHPWLGSQDAYRAAQRAVGVPLYKLPARAQMIGADELLSEALSILTECALPERGRVSRFCAFCGGPMPEGCRPNAKYCKPQCSSSYRDQRARGYGQKKEAPVAEAAPKTHIGSMWSWPEDERFAYAVREVGLRLCNFVRVGHLETPASQTIANLPLAEVEDVDALGIAGAWLEANGLFVTGNETVEELEEAVAFVKARTEAA